MASLKEDLRNLAIRITTDRRRAELVERRREKRNKIRRSTTASISPGQYNMCFVGNPGTGKTAIARYMAKVFYSLGIIEHPRVMEIRGLDLTGEYLGQTKAKVNDIFEKNAGCVIVIDEVYSLLSPRAHNTDSYGQQAIDTLVGCITDPRNATTVVVIAGYKDRMDEFLAANQGLASRFGTTIEFHPYTDSDCVKILHKLLEDTEFDYPKDDEFRQQLVSLFANIRKQMGVNFGNARTVGSIFKQIIDKQTVRVHQLDNPGENELFTVLPVDIPQHPQST